MLTIKGAKWAPHLLQLDAIPKNSVAILLMTPKFMTPLAALSSLKPIFNGPVIGALVDSVGLGTPGYSLSLVQGTPFYAKHTRSQFKQVGRWPSKLGSSPQTGAFATISQPSLSTIKWDLPKLGDPNLILTFSDADPHAVYAHLDTIHPNAMKVVTAQIVWIHSSTNTFCQRESLYAVLQ